MQYEELKQVKGHNAPIRDLLVCDKYDLLFSSAKDSSIFSWDLNKLNFYNNLVGHKDSVTRLDINTSETLLASSSWD